MPALIPSCGSEEAPPRRSGTWDQKGARESLLKHTNEVSSNVRNISLFNSPACKDFCDKWPGMLPCKPLNSVPRFLDQLDELHSGLPLCEVMTKAPIPCLTSAAFTMGFL